MKDNLYRVAVHNPKGRLERYRMMRLMSGQLHVTGAMVTLTKDSTPFSPRVYRVLGKDSEGVPMVQVR